MTDRKRLREMGVPEDMSADDVKAFFSLPDDDSMHQQMNRDEILQKMQVLRIHAAGASKSEKARLNRDFKALYDRLQEIDGGPGVVGNAGSGS